MSEKRLDIKVGATTEFSVEEARKKIRALNDEASGGGKSGGGGGGHGRDESGIAGFFRGLKHDSHETGLHDIGNLLKGAGAVGALVELGHMAGETAKALGEYKEFVKYGGAQEQGLAMVVADTIPVVGDVAKGFTRLWEEISGYADELKEAEELLAADKAANQAKIRRDDRRTKALFENSEAGRKAGGELLPTNLDTAIALSRKAEAEKLAAQLKGSRFGALSPEGQDLVEKSHIKQALKEAEIQAIADKERAKATHDEAILQLNRERDRVRPNLAPDQVPEFDRNFQKRTNKADYDQTSANAKAEAALAQAQLQAQNATVAQAKESKDRQTKRKEFDINLLGMQEELLKQSGLQGKLEVERTAIKKQIAEKDLELERQQNDPSLTADQRRFAGQLREHLPGLQRELLSNVREPEPTNKTQLQSSRFLTGVGQGEHAVEKNTAEMKNLLKTIVDFMRSQIRTATAGGGATIPPFLTGN